MGNRWFTLCPMSTRARLIRHDKHLRVVDQDMWSGSGHAVSRRPDQGLKSLPYAECRDFEMRHINTGVDVEPVGLPADFEDDAAPFGAKGFDVSIHGVSPSVREGESVYAPSPCAGCSACNGCAAVFALGGKAA